MKRTVTCALTKAEFLLLKNLRNLDTCENYALCEVLNFLSAKKTVPLSEKDMFDYELSIMEFKHMEKYRTLAGHEQYVIRYLASKLYKTIRIDEPNKQQQESSHEPAPVRATLCGASPYVYQFPTQLAAGRE
jgi:hypothetical protein